MTCTVCCEAYNLSTRKKVTCPFCPFEVCSGCSERYLTETSEDAHCMNCRRGWSRENLVENFSQKFVSKIYKSRREELLLEREKSLMPATQIYVELEKAIRALNTEIAHVKNDLNLANIKWNAINSQLLPAVNGEPAGFDLLVDRHKKSQEQRKAVSNLMIDLQHMEWHQNQLINRLHGRELAGVRRQFVRACPFADCRGFLSSAWKCGICENWTCPECHEVKGTDREAPHQCDPSNVATAQMLARDSRNCPKCAALIFKIDGCDQMFCTQCHTPFSWRTGIVETGRIHNPHYYEFQRARGGVAREPGDAVCGGLPDWHRISPLIGPNHVFRPIVAAAHRMHPHIQYTVIPRYTPDMANDNRDLRIKFMIGDFGEDEFKRKIQQREKARMRKTDIRLVLEMYQAVLTDLFQNFVQDRGVAHLIDSLLELRHHVNTTMDAVSKRWNSCAVPRISENFVI